MTTQTSVPQHLRALALANEIRMKRARLKRDLKAGRVDPASLLDDPDCATMTIGQLLMTQRSIGRVRAQRALCRAGISMTQTLASLTSRQRAALFGERADSIGGTRQNRRGR